jgi:molybdate transport system ATP-binding protein
MNMLAVDVEKRLGDFSLAARFETAAGVTALFGASGAGKTTLVNMIAGLLAPDRGRIRLDDDVLFDSAARIDLPAHRRRIGYVFQEGRLFPHLSVAANLDYGRRMCGLARDGAEMTRIVNLLDIGHLLDRRPGKLSGGERQRVAVGRALLMRPRLLLLDEEARDPALSRKAPRRGAHGLCQPPRGRIETHRDLGGAARRRPRGCRRWHRGARRRHGGADGVGHVPLYLKHSDSARSVRPLPRLQPNSGLPEFGQS